MAQTLDCPKCGAPLEFDPKPGDETVECPYCHETVIIPKDLRIPLPRVVIKRDAAPPRRGISPGGWIFFAVVGVILVAIVVSMIADNSSSTTSDSPTETAEFGNAATMQPLGNPTTTVEARSTLDALQPLLTLEQAWPSSFTEAFQDNANKWPTGDVRDTNFTGNRGIASGVYTWHITTTQGTSDFAFPTMPFQEDFYASVDMKLDSMPDDADADAGMVFRHKSSDSTWYYFSANDKGQYYFGWYDGSNWSTLIHETDSSAIRVGSTNRLAVGAKGSQFIFFINGQMVDHFVDDHLIAGDIGVGINLPGSGEKGIVEFDNLTVLAPKP